MKRFIASLLTSGLVVLASAQAAEPEAPTQAQVQAWVESAYPALAASAALPERFAFGFVISPEGKVIAHSAIVRPNPRPMNADLAEMFPNVSLDGSPMGGISRARTAQGAQLREVIWVIVPERR